MSERMETREERTRRLGKLANSHELGCAGIGCEGCFDIRLAPPSPESQPTCPPYCEECAAERQQSVPPVRPTPSPAPAGGEQAAREWLLSTQLCAWKMIATQSDGLVTTAGTVAAWLAAYDAHRHAALQSEVERLQPDLARALAVANTEIERLVTMETEAFDILFPYVPEADNEQGESLTYIDKLNRCVAAFEAKIRELEAVKLSRYTEEELNTRIEAAVQREREAIKSLVEKKGVDYADHRNGAVVSSVCAQLKAEISARSQKGEGQ